MTQAEELRALALRARNVRMTPEQKHAQRISMVMGLRGHSSTLTTEKVETILKEIEGLPA